MTPGSHLPKSAENEENRGRDVEAYRQHTGA